MRAIVRDEPGVGGDAFVGGSRLDAAFSDSGRRSVMRPESSSPTRRRRLSEASSVTTTSSGSRPASRTSTRPDPSWPEISSGGLAEEVEQAEVERRPERLAQAASGLGGRLVPECCGRAELLLDRLDVTVELHRDITMTS